MRYFTLAEPRFPVHEGDVWASPKGHQPSFERIMTDGKWVDAHQESDDERQKRAEAEQQQQGSGIVSGGAGTDAQGNGDHGQSAAGTGDGRQQEPGEVTRTTDHFVVDSIGEEGISLRRIDGPKGEGLDDDGPAVV